MDLYAKFVLPRLIDLAMRNKETARLRAAWIPHARGEVLEVGIGSGLNLSFYSPEVQRVYGVDPSRELNRIARKRAAAGSTQVEFLSQSAEEQLPFAKASMDTVVVTWTLFHPERSNRTTGDEARSKAERAAYLSGAWPCSRSWRVRLAGPAHAGLEAYGRRVPPKS